MPRKRKHPKWYYRMKGRSTIGICEEVEEKGIFDLVRYSRDYGQTGACVEVERGDYEANLKRIGWPTSDGYNGTQENPTRLTYLSIFKTTRTGNRRHFGTYDTDCFKPQKRHKFEKDAEKSPKLKAFLDDILTNFNVI